MIQNLFIPNAINNYYLISQKVCHFELHRNHVTACQLLVAGRTITVQAIVREELEFDSGLTYEQLVSAALKKIIKKQKFNLISLTVPSTHTIFKELELPFSDAQKINQVIHFELESQLPFAIDKAAVSFIITKQDPVQKSSRVLAAVVQTKDLEYYQELFKKAGLKGVDQFTVELFDNYALWQKLPAEQVVAGAELVLNLGDNSTSVMYLNQHQLQLARILPRGFSHLVRQFAQRAKLTYPEALNFITQVNLTNNLTASNLALSVSEQQTQRDPKLLAHLKAVLAEYCSLLTSTLTTFAANLPQAQLNLSKISLLQTEQPIAGLAELIGHALNIPCRELTLNSALDPKIFKTNLSLNNTDFGVLAGAYNSTVSDHSKLEYGRTSSGLLKNQIAVGLSFSVLILGGLSGHIFWQLYTLNQKLHVAEQETINRLSKTFNLEAKEKSNLKLAISSAESKVEHETKVWFAFSRQTSVSILACLAELSKIIKPEELGLKLNTLTLADNQVKLAGQVQDYPALNKLTFEFKDSPLFELTEKPQKLDFELILNIKNGGTA